MGILQAEFSQRGMECAERDVNGNRADNAGWRTGQLSWSIRLWLISSTRIGTLAAMTAGIHGTPKRLSCTNGGGGVRHRAPHEVLDRDHARDGGVAGGEEQGMPMIIRTANSPHIPT